jgi:hypothetical protein
MHQAAALDWSVLVGNPLIAELWGGDMSASAAGGPGGAAGGAPGPEAPRGVGPPTRSLGAPFGHESELA